jgi:hypothetical protein
MRDGWFALNLKAIWAVVIEGSGAERTVEPLL